MTTTDISPATLGDLSLACEFLRPGGGEAVRRIVSPGLGQELRVQVRGYLEAPPRLSAAQIKALESSGEEASIEDLVPGDALEISRHLFEKLRGGHHLIFANARQSVELFSDLLRRHCDLHGIPNEFWPHHGNLSRDLREETEAAIKDRARPASAVCTTTLELGIDVGAIESVAQIGAPPSVASLRQRLGRSGRQGGAAVLRAYLREPEIDERTPPHYRLRAQLVQTIAAVQLLIAGWCEPPEAGALHLSTLVQQVLSTIAQHGGARADQMWRALCREGAFRAVNAPTFADLLRSLAATELIRQLHTGEVVLDLAGERIVNHYPGLYVIFGGRRWEVLEVDQERKTVDLKPAQGGRLPTFEGGRGAPVHERVRKEMLAIYQSGAVPPFLDARARELLAEGRSHFARLGLGGQRLIPDSQGAILFGWQGDRVMDTLLVWLSARRSVILSGR